jgi:hypothetical protein
LNLTPTPGRFATPSGFDQDTPRATVAGLGDAGAVTLQAMRGLDLVAAVTVLAEIGDLSRFQTPRELMGYLGLVPSESSTGDRRLEIQAVIASSRIALLRVSEHFLLSESRNMRWPSSAPRTDNSTMTIPRQAIPNRDASSISGWSASISHSAIR